MAHSEMEIDAGREVYRALKSEGLLTIDLLPREFFDCHAKEIEHVESFLLIAAVGVGAAEEFMMKTARADSKGTYWRDRLDRCERGNILRRVIRRTVKKRFPDLDKVDEDGLCDDAVDVCTQHYDVFENLGDYVPNAQELQADEKELYAYMIPTMETLLGYTLSGDLNDAFPPLCNDIMSPAYHVSFRALRRVYEP